MSFNPEQERPRGNMTAWVDRAAAYGVGGELLSQLIDDKIATLERVKQLGLPCYAWCKTSPADFLADPASHFTQLSSDKYWLYLLSNSGLPRLTDFGLDAQQAIDYVGRHAASSGEAYDTLLVIEVFTNIYGGNIVVKDGVVYGELVEGEHAALTKDSATPLSTFATDPFTSVLRHSNSELPAAARQGVYAALRSIPTSTPVDFEDSFRGRVPHTGYYEFVLAQRALGAGLSPIFIDYNDHPAFFPPMFRQ